MTPMIPYMAVTDSSDGTIQKGDILWLSRNRQLNCLTGPGWLEPEEWQVSGTSDFLVVEETGYEVIRIGKNESIMKRRSPPAYDPYELVKKQQAIIERLHDLNRPEGIIQAEPDGEGNTTGTCPACGKKTSVTESPYRCRYCGKAVLWDNT